MKTKIYPYTFVKLKEGNYFIILDVRKRITEIGETNDLIISGIELHLNLNNFIAFDGKTTKQKINIKKASMSEINKFIENNSYYAINNAWRYTTEIKEVFHRDNPISFMLTY